MNRLTTILTFVLVAASMFAGCQAAPKTAADREALISQAETRIRQYKASDPSMNEFFKTSYGYAVFPDVGSGAFIVGGSYGRGVVYEHGTAIGFADITSGSIGLQAGGQGFSQIIFFQTANVLKDFTSGTYSFSADANAVAVDAGAAGQTTFKNGVAVFIRSQSGLMAAAAVGGQKFSYSPL